VAAPPSVDLTPATFWQAFSLRGDPPKSPLGKGGKAYLFVDRSNHSITVPCHWMLFYGLRIQ